MSSSLSCMFQILHHFSILTLLLHFLSPAMATIYADQHKFLKAFLRSNRCEGNDSDSDSDSSSDHFRMYEFKIRMCTRSRSHDWTDCPFAHPGEKARRRDPRRYHYSATVCADFRRGICSRGDNCELAHGVFESWLHPDRYRTEVCKDGKDCKRKICFFAHIPRQLRIRGSHRCDYYNCFMSSPISSLMGTCNFAPPLTHFIRHVDGEAREMNELASSMNCMMRLRDDGGSNGLNPCNGNHELMFSSSFGSADTGVLVSPDLGWVDDLLG